ncbi:hypothetical protein KRX11_04505 [Pasteurellaceae bacterium TAE3-ERU1]|nr:hypothetical protein [Pasteurellaceae bacterium TAE3-ERU1]
MKIETDDKRPEVIVCAAVRFTHRDQKDINLGRKGTEMVIPMVRHFSPDGREVLDFMQPYSEEVEIKEIEQGFITSQYRFVNRKEAFEIAKSNNQIKYSVGYKTNILFSEMLY